MSEGLVATASTTIHAPSTAVWQALVTPAAIKQYMFGTDVESDWKQGSPIVWRGEWQGKSYEDRGVILRIRERHTLQYTHFSPLAGLPDAPEHYHTVTLELTADGPDTRVVLSQDNHPTEQARDHSEKNWAMVLAGVKQFVER